MLNFFSTLLGLCLCHDLSGTSARHELQKPKVKIYDLQFLAAEIHRDVSQESKGKETTFTQEIAGLIKKSIRDNDG